MVEAAMLMKHVCLIPRETHWLKQQFTCIVNCGRSLLGVLLEQPALMPMCQPERSVPC